jgi:hypothetical protein
VCERWIIAALRHRKFFNLPELNQAIRELLLRLNERPFRKRDGSRSSLFHSLEKPALAPLPAERFDMSQWMRAAVNIDYHIAWTPSWCVPSWSGGPHWRSYKRLRRRACALSFASTGVGIENGSSTEWKPSVAPFRPFRIGR